MGLRQNSNRMSGLGKPRPISGPMYGGTQGRPMLLHNAATGSVNGGLNAHGTSAVSRSAARQGQQAPQVQSAARGAQKGSQTPQKVKQVHVNRTPLASMYADSIYDRNMAQLRQSLETQLSDLLFQQRTGKQDYKQSRRDLNKQHIIDQQRVNAQAGLVGGGGDMLVIPEINQFQDRYGDLVRAWGQQNNQFYKQMNLAKKYYNAQKLAEEGIAKERYNAWYGS